jgi:hypothetical protein
MSASRCAHVSPTQTIGVNPARHAPQPLHARPHRKVEFLFDCDVNNSLSGANISLRRGKLLQFIEAIRLLRGYLSCVEKIRLAASVDNKTIIGKHIADLAVLATTDRCPIGESSASAIVAAGRSAALDYIASHFSDPRPSLAKWRGA